MDDIEKALQDQTGATGPAGASGASGASGSSPAPTEEEARKAQALADLAVIEANKKAALADLQKARAEKRQLKKESGESGPVEKIIDENDPDAKPWLKKINDSISPVRDELDKEKSEIRQFALDEFLADKPALAKSPEKLKAVLVLYDKIKTASERTTQGVLLDLRRAYAAEFHDELLEADRQNRVEGVRRDSAFSEAGISRGSTAYSSPKEARVKLTPAEEQLAIKWYGSPEAYAKMKSEQDKKLEEAV